MIGTLKGDRVALGKESIDELYNTLYYGRLKENELELALVEAAYLLDRDKISVEHEGKKLSFRDFFIIASQAQEYFELKYIVYRDLRERGYYVQPSVTDFRIYPRGGKPNVSPSKYFMHVVTERKPMPMQQLVSNLQAAVNVRKEMILAIVDEESDITYYGVKFNNLKGGMGELKVPSVPGAATFLEDRVVIWDTELSKFLHNNGFHGNMLDDKRLQLSLVESAYLLSTGRLEVLDSATGKPLEIGDFIEKASRIEELFEGKLKVYTDLRNRGLVVKTGFKFGSNFRVYEKVESAEKIPHSKFLVDSVGAGHVFQLQDMSRSIRLANSVRKEMVFAFEKNGEIQYFSLGRIKL
ncbi:tRNA-intron lyase [Methanocella sp. CWC-04]|uniref:tRNA-splicing endonuclease n=1 Tax=Methanooceanicella nereidis TaxID=2052831 RepID=A0AAP2RF81_9EURY|nr:tRNA-intron lyase [Methanocella sp. CWC-04]MCD1295015.1 tRNA-intron lyase [Methanocella sp. CWC-04]